MFKTYKATINHGGKIFHQIEKSDLTAAEIIMLKAVHGPQGVVNIIETKGDKLHMYTNETEDGAFKTLSRPATINDEKMNLSEKYGDKRFAEVFPGFVPQLPTDLAQVGVDYVALPVSTVEQFKVEQPKVEEAKDEDDTASTNPRLPKHLRS